MQNWKDRGYVADSDDEDTPLTTASDNEDDLRTRPLGSSQDDGSGEDEASFRNEEEEPDWILRAGTRDLSREDRLSVTRPLHPYQRREQKATNEGQNGLGAFLQELQDASESTGPDAMHGLSDDIQFPSSLPLADDPEYGQINTAASSPLSDARSDVEMDNIPIMHLQSTSTADLLQHASQLSSPHAFQLDQSMTAPSRAFRTRKAIQLHPYLLESEKYKQTMRAGGYKPVQIAPSQELGATQPVRRPRVQRYEGSSEHSASQESYQSSPPLAQEPTSSTISPQGHLDRDVQAGPPSTGRLSKRRKLFHIPVITPARGHSHLNLKDVPHENSSPPTPPTSNSGDSLAVPRYVIKESGFKLPRNLAKEGEHASTPALRSNLLPAAAATPALGTYGEEPDQSESDQALPEATREAESERATESGSSDNDVQFQSARKRIRGVLPASWLRMDKKTGPTNNEKRRQGLESRTDSAVLNGGRGIAQRKTTTLASPDKVGNRFADFSSSSEDERPIETPLRRPAALANAAPSTVDLLYDSDQMEDNAIDAMLPGEFRRRQSPNASKKRQKRQTRIDQSFDRPRATSRQPRGQSNLRPVKHKSKSVRPRGRQPPLSIIDLDPPSPSRETVVPVFVRLAKRQARKRPDGGRHSPSSKTIRLPTSADTEDAMTTLAAWKQGKIMRRTPIGRTDTSRRPAPRSPVAKGMSLATSTVQKSRADQRITDGSMLPGSHHILQSQPLSAQQKAGLESNHSSEQQEQSGPSNNRIGKILLARRGHVQSTARSRERFRTAQLEVESSNDVNNFRTGSLGLHAYNLANLLRQQPNVIQTHSLQLRRFLHEEDTLPTSDDHTQPAGPTEQSDTTRAEPVHSSKASPQKFQITRRKARKPAPTRLPVEVVEYRQPAIPPPTFTNGDDVATATHSSGGLQGLYHGAMPIDFDVQHLPLGTFFHSSTFLGSGDFAKALSVGVRDLSLPAGHITIRVDDTATRWSEWTDETADWLRSVKDVCIEVMQFLASATSDDEIDSLSSAHETMSYLLRSIVRYISSCLQCPDEQTKFRFCDTLQRFVEDLADSLAMKLQRTDLLDTAKSHLVDGVIYLLTLNAQICLLTQGSNDLVQQSTGSAVLLRQLSHIAFRALFQTGCGQIQTCLQKLQHHSVRDVGIKDDQVAVKLIVVLRCIMQVVGVPQLSFDRLVADLWKDRFQDTVEVRRLDMVWYDMFSLQPLLEVDASGIYRYAMLKTSGSPQPCWGLVRMLLDQTLPAYSSTAAPDQRHANDYLKAVLGRTLLLIVRWKWRGAESALASIYDFFAKRDLTNLSGERPSGSPAFLSHLGEYQDLDIGHADLGFHAFLKLLAVGLRAASKELPANKLKRVVWRFIPNHGRTYRKDQEVRQTDLDALRNHHDILCTLFWALPAGSRPRLDHIRNLVDFNTSHLEACRINIDAWRNLAVFIMSDKNQHLEIPELGVWFRDLTDVLINQYRLARSEAEELFEMSKERQSGAISYDVMQMTVTSNQRRILNTLQDAIQAFGLAITTCNDRTKQLDMVKHASFTGLLKVFDATQSRTFESVERVLAIIKPLLNSDNHSQSNGQSEESQDYGDWDGLDDVIGEQPSYTGMKVNAVTILQPGVNQLLSNCFGADTSIDDPLLDALTNTWCSLAFQSVANGQRSWADYLDSHGSLSWYQLRNTKNFQQYTPLMLASILTLDGASFDDYSTSILTQWVASLVAPESRLKYQHALTSALLNTQSYHVLLYNLPFAADSSGRHDVSLSDLRARRLALLAAILSNIRTSLSGSRPSLLPDLKRSHSTILRSMMTAMKDTYLSFTGTSPAHATGMEAEEQHTIFLQQLVSLLQQYTSDIVTIDPFFTDPRSFPLPTNDPKYLVARLKGYVPKLSSEKGRKQLSIFLQTVLSKAVLHGESGAVSLQLEQALFPSKEEINLENQDMSEGLSTRPWTLRRTMIEDILPAYLRVAASKMEAMFFVLPILVAVGKVLERSAEIVDLSQKEMARREERALKQFLGLLLESLEITGRGAVQLTDIRAYLAASALDAVRGMVSIVDFMHRATNEGQEMLETLEGVRTVATTIARNDSADQRCLTVDGVSRQDTSRCSEVVEYARQSLADELSRTWCWDGEKLLHGRVGQKEEVYVPELRLVKEERVKMQIAAKSLLREMQIIIGGTGEAEEYNEPRQEHGQVHSGGVDHGLADLAGLYI
ncbi:hypothetical protein KVT40_005107 [Elsinoe batatas]|uniref:Mus7/MMS22 family-domain-containing protein n=1 Tax=Elsinoe batatas TaxID=2601811 RepID=A0A8K0L362_9PEZI|nr:hypothetical protein KVT40_005107 [Elsinoe batatas]